MNETPSPTENQSGRSKMNELRLGLGLLFGILALAIIWWAVDGRFSEGPQQRVRRKPVQDGKSNPAGLKESPKVASTNGQSRIGLPVLEHRKPKPLPEEFAELLSRPRIPRIREPSPRAIERIEEILKTDPPQGKPLDLPTITQSEYAEKRREWYLENWLGSYRKYATPNPAWAEMAEEFVKEAASKFTPAGFPEAIRLELEPAAAALLRKGCDDPLALSLVAKVLPRELDMRKTLEYELPERFLRSGYPVPISYWASFPHISPEWLLILQADRSGGDLSRIECPFHSDDSLELRFLYDHFRSYPDRAKDRRNPELIHTLITQTAAEPWLKNMLFGEFVRLRGQDMTIVRKIAAEYKKENPDGPPLMVQQIEGGVNLPQLWARERLVIERWDSERNFYLGAWEMRPENPEAAAMLLKIANEEWAYLGRPGSSGGEDPSFWYEAAQKAQFDYPGLHREYALYLNRPHAKIDADLTNFARGLVETERFDTLVPAEFLFVLDRIVDNEYLWSRVPKMTIRRRLGSPFVRESLEALFENYRDDPRIADQFPKIQTYLTSATFYGGEVEKAFPLFEALGDKASLPEFDRVGFSLREMEVARHRKSKPDAFDIGPARVIRGLWFSDEGNSLICIDQSNKGYRFQTPTGNIDWTSPAEWSLGLLAVSPGGEEIIMFDRSGEVTAREPGTFEWIREYPWQPGNWFFGNQGQNDYWGLGMPHEKKRAMTLEIRRISDRESTVVLKTHFLSISAVHVAGDSARAAMLGDVVDENGSTRTEVAVWDLKSGDRLYNANPFSRSFTEFAIARDGEFLAAYGTNHVEKTTRGIGFDSYQDIVGIVEVPSGEARWAIALNCRAKAMQLVDGDRVLVVGGQDGIIRALDVSNGKLIAEFFGHNAPVTSLGYHASKKTLASGDEDGRVFLWSIDGMDTKTQRQMNLSTYRFRDLADLVVDPKTEDIVTNSRAGQLIWSAESDYQNHRDVSKTPPPEWSSNGKSLTVRFAAGGSRPGISHKLSIERQNGSGETIAQEVPVVSRHAPKFLVHPNGKSIITSGDAGMIWNAATGTPWSTGSIPGPIHDIALSETGEFLATLTIGPANGQVSLWRLPADFSAESAKPERIQTFETLGKLDAPQWGRMSLCLSPDGRTVVVGKRSAVEVWDAPSATHRGDLRGNRAQGRSGPSISPDGKWIVTCGNDYDFFLYDAATLKLLRRVQLYGEGADNMRWGPKSRRVYYSVRGWVHCLDVGKGESILPIVH